MPQLLTQLGFKDNPFATYVAENEPNIDKYFVRPPYFPHIHERGMGSKTMILFGARGAGKSATRLALHKEAWTALNSNKSAPLVITLDDYSRIISKDLSLVGVGEFLREIGYLVVESVLVWLSALEDDDRNVFVEGLNAEEKRLAVALVDHFYLSRPDEVREISGTQALKLLNQAWSSRSSLWVQKRWGAVVQLVGSIARALAKKGLDVDVPIDEGLNKLLASPSDAWNEAHFARAIIQRYVEFARSFGFTGVTVLIDKIDETTKTNNSATASAQLLYPVLANTQLVEIDGFGWLFFLWDRVREQYTSDRYPVRLDKIAHASISWGPSFLKSLITERLTYFSNKKIKTFSELCCGTIDAEDALNDVIMLAMQSPRELIRLMDTLIQEHDDISVSNEEPLLLTTRSMELGLDRYSIETTKRLFPRSLIQQILKLRMNNFINKDLQAAFKINANSVRNRLTSWIDSGIVAQTGSRPAEGGAGGKPALEYSVIDVRVRRLIDRNLSLGEEYEYFEEANEDTEEPAGSGTDE